VHVADVVRGLLFAIDRSDFDGPFNMSAPKPVTMNEFARALAHALHRPSFLRVPGLALQIALGEGLASALLTGQRAVPARLERAGFTFQFETLEAALADLIR
jgi:NAD dependent epimerase/dehydratase family enzyme